MHPWDLDCDSVTTDLCDVNSGHDAVDAVACQNVGVFEKKWLRTYADRVWTDNLLALPRY